MLDLSIQIVNYNSYIRTKETIQSVIDNTEGIAYEIIVVDNASTDNSAVSLKKGFPQIIIIENSENKFFSPAHNQAGNTANGKYLLILNSDVTVHKGTLLNMFQFLENNPEYGAVSPRILSDVFESHNWKRRTIKQIIGSRVPFSFFFKKSLSKTEIINQEQGNKITDCEVASDSCIMLSKEMFDNIGGYDENMLLYYTEDDLCHKINIMNKKIAILNCFSVFHEGTHTSKKIKKLRIFNLENQDRIYYVKKYFGIVPSLLIRISGFLEKMILNIRGDLKN